MCRSKAADHEANRGGAEGCRSAKLRVAQTHPRIRRRDEQAAQAVYGMRRALLEGQEQKQS